VEIASWGRYGPAMRALAILIPFVAGCAADPSYLSDLHDEAPGSNCTNGGIRVVTGPDSNGNGQLDPGEITSTKYVCAGGSTLTKISNEPPGDNCPAGGAKLETGLDMNGNNTLDADEVTATEYVCGAGEAQIVRAFNPVNTGVTADSGQAITLISAELTTTTPGKVFAIGTADVYCTAQQCPAGSPAADGYMWISSVDNLGVPATDHSYFHLVPTVSEGITRTMTFTLDSGGTRTFYLRGQDDIGAFTFYRVGLTLVFLP
jgi:hypothetical protein